MIDKETIIIFKAILFWLDSKIGCRKGGMMVKKDIILAEGRIGSIQRCRHGIVHIHCKGVSLHFNEDAFFAFASMVGEGVSKLMDDNLAEF